MTVCGSQQWIWKKRSSIEVRDEMDRETAIDLLDNLLGMVEDNHDSDYDAALHMGIDALKTQDMSGNMSGTQNPLDCISRRAAVDAVANGLKRVFVEYQDVAEKLLNNVPSVQPQRWIPVTERLPENGHYYLKCTKYGNVDVDYYWDGFENATKYGEEIVAWMEKPKPYKGGQDETN